MPLPKKTIRVFPNPWGFIHHELGPQGRCHEDAGGRGSDPRYIGAELHPEKTIRLAEYEQEKNETRLDPWRVVFRFPSLDAELLGPATGFEQGIELPKTPYYLDRLRDGDLIPADERSGEHGARFKSLAEAKEAGVAAFEAHYDVGSFQEVMSGLAAALAPLPQNAPEAAPAKTDSPTLDASASTAPAPEQAAAAAPAQANTQAAPKSTATLPAEADTSAATPIAKRSRSNGGQS